MFVLAPQSLLLILMGEIDSILSSFFFFAYCFHISLLFFCSIMPLFRSPSLRFFPKASQSASTYEEG